MGKQTAQVKKVYLKAFPNSETFSHIYYFFIEKKLISQRSQEFHQFTAYLLNLRVTIWWQYGMIHMYENAQNLGMWLKTAKMNIDSKKNYKK